MKDVVFLSGFPRSGSTLLANILAMHNGIYATPSSPLCSIINGMRRQWSDEPFLLAQLDSNPDETLKRLKRATISFMTTYSDNGYPITIDKNRGWIYQLELLRELHPNFKMIITLRDLRDILTSIEKRHRQTLLIDFPDHMEPNVVDRRTAALFDDNGIVGSILKGIYNIGDIPNITNHLYFWKYEDFLKDPDSVIKDLFKFIDVPQQEIDFNNIIQSTNESDSYYRMKYPHTIETSIKIPEGRDTIPVSPRILDSIVERYQWFYKDYYPELFQNDNQAPVGNSTPDDSKMIADLEEAIKKEAM